MKFYHRLGDGAWTHSAGLRPWTGRGRGARPSSPALLPAHREKGAPVPPAGLGEGFAPGDRHFGAATRQEARSAWVAGQGEGAGAVKRAKDAKDAKATG